MGLRFGIDCRWSVLEWGKVIVIPLPFDVWSIVTGCGIAIRLHESSIPQRLFDEDVLDRFENVGHIARVGGAGDMGVDFFG